MWIIKYFNVLLEAETPNQHILKIDFKPYKHFYFSPYTLVQVNITALHGHSDLTWHGEFSQMQAPENPQVSEASQYGCALPNVTSRVLVVGLRLGMAEQHIFQCGVFSYPTTTGEEVETDGASSCACWFPQISAKRGLQPKPHCLPLILSRWCHRAFISIPWMTFERRSVQTHLPLPMSSWVDALIAASLD